MQQVIAYIIQQAAALGMSALQYITNNLPDLIRKYDTISSLKSLITSNNENINY